MNAWSMDNIIHLKLFVVRITVLLRVSSLRVSSLSFSLLTVSADSVHCCRIS